MAEINKPDFTYLWSSGGSAVAPSNTKIQTGWTAEVPPFQWENWSQNRQDQGIAHVLQHGVAVWDSLTEYQAGKSYVQGSDGLLYKALTTNTNVNPVTDTTFVNWTKGPGRGGLLNVAVFATNGTFTYTPTPGTSFVVVEVQAAGGAGGGTPATTAGQFAIAPGGGAGGYAKAMITAGFSGVPVVVGLGGVGVNGAAGGSGGSSSFGSFVTSTGANGAALGSAFTTTAILASGNNRGSGTVTASATCIRLEASRGESGGSAIGTSPANFVSGPGGTSFFGGGGDAVITQSLPGGAGSTAGSGGAGAGAGGSAGAQTGGNGANGLVLVWEYQ